MTQIGDPVSYPEIKYLAEKISEIVIYSDWNASRYSPAKSKQSVNQLKDVLQYNGGNLALVLNRIRMDIETKNRLLKELKIVYERVEDYEILLSGDEAQVVFIEKGLKAPIQATRLSDGVMRYLSLLTILINPSSSSFPIICIKYPELGLHRDYIKPLARLIREASETCQLVLTTHSDILIDNLKDIPQSLIECNNLGDGTILKRLN
jgi:predicted ATPase